MKLLLLLVFVFTLVACPLSDKPDRCEPFKQSIGCFKKADTQAKFSTCNVFYVDALKHLPRLELTADQEKEQQEYTDQANECTHQAKNLSDGNQCSINLLKGISRVYNCLESIK